MERRLEAHMTRRIATIDVGTNTALLLVAAVTPGGRLESVYEEERFVRLGEGVDAARRLRPEAVDRVLAALADYRAAAERYGAEVVAVGGTSASRDAANRDELIERVRDELGLDYEIVSGPEEARWAFAGACSAFPDLDEACVLDVGGGSSELAAGPARNGPRHRASLDVGAIRLTERCFPTVPPPPEAVAAAEALVAEQLASVDFGCGVPLVGAAGTVSALARLAAPDDPWRELDRETVEAWRDRLLTMTPGAVRALDPAILTGREDVFAAGVLIVAAVMRHLDAPTLRPSPRGLRHGLALRWLAGAGME